ncbi:MAG TPA: three component ABC system middle component, partial [Chthoniobacterales bacterium]|nr:three component ABC system middle component [Chthoniobacterales bacterium]
PWSQRPLEEQRLLNPSFCAILLWHAASGYRREAAASGAMPFAETFLVLPAVLHAEARQSLPKTISTSLAAWVGENPVSRAIIADRARSLVPFTKEAMLFGALHGALRVSGVGLAPDLSWAQRITSDVPDSEEVQSCVKRSTFVGRWFGRTGDAETVLALFGVQP